MYSNRDAAGLLVTRYTVKTARLKPEFHVFGVNMHELTSRQYPTRSLSMFSTLLLPLCTSSELVNSLILDHQFRGHYFQILSHKQLFSGAMKRVAWF